MNENENRENEVFDDGEELEIVTLLTDESEEAEFWHVLTFPYEGKKYSALVPIEEIESEEPSVIFVRIEHDKDGDAYYPVENEILLDELMAEFSELSSRTVTVFSPP